MGLSQRLDTELSEMTHDSEPRRRADPATGTPFKERGTNRQGPVLGSLSPAAK